MPIPTPAKGEDKQKFISRCISALHHTDPNRDDDQIKAMCYTQWRKKGENMDSDEKGKVRFSVPVKIEESKTDKGQNTYIVGNAVDAGVSRNNVNYSMEELEKSAHTLIGRPLLLNHGHKDVRNIIGKVIQAGFDGQNVPFKAILDGGETDIIRKIKSGFIDSVSICADYDEPVKTDDEGIMHPTNLKFLELSLVTIPGVPNATISQVITERYEEKKTMQEAKTIEDLQKQLSEVKKERDSLITKVKEQDEADSESSEEPKEEEPAKEEPNKETEALKKAFEKLEESVSRLEKEKSKSVVMAEKSTRPKVIEMVEERNDKGIGIDFYPKGMTTATSREDIKAMSKEFY